MAESVTLELMSNPYLSSRNEGPGQRGTEEVWVFVDRVALNSPEDQLVNKLLLEVFDDCMRLAPRAGAFLTTAAKSSS